MSAPYLTRDAREAVEKVLTAAGFKAMADDVWCRLGPIHGPWKVDLREVFPEPCPERGEAAAMDGLDQFGTLR